jgi:endonuclease YncB( thermonuclease family)
MISKMTILDLNEYLYWYRVRIDFLYDADTITAMQLDFGFGISQIVKRGDGKGIRFFGLNAPEMRTTEGKELTKRLKPLEGTTVFAKSHKDKSGKYGRYLFEIYVPYNTMYGGEDDTTYINLNEFLIEEGLAPAQNY